MREKKYSLGVDGGGTKTHAVIVNENEEIVGQGWTGVANPLRVGLDDAMHNVRAAILAACHEAGIEPAQIEAAEIGLAGVRRKDMRVKVTVALADLNIAQMQVVTDAETALYGATQGAPGVVIIAGTGSICCGMNARRERECAGGWGPLAGDEGSGSWIARRALQAVAQASDGRSAETALTAAAFEYFGAPSVEDLMVKICEPGMTNERIAGFARRVIEAARAGDEVAREILNEAGRALGKAATAVIQKLKLGRTRFQVAYVGGIFAAGELIMQPLRATINAVAPKAYLSPPRLSPALAAARLAREQEQHEFALAS